jgi:putative transposase
LSTKLISENQAICIEDLHVKGMVSNRHLAKSIITSGFGAFFGYLAYKAEEQHRKLILAPRWFPSTSLCSCCHKQPSQRIKLSVKSWTCEYCQAELDRDINAANNLLYVADQTRAIWQDSHKTIFKAPISKIMYQARTA